MRTVRQLTEQEVEQRRREFEHLDALMAEYDSTPSWRWRKRAALLRKYSAYLWFYTP